MSPQDVWDRELRRQRIVDELARTGRGRPAGELVLQLRDWLDAERLSPMPLPWLEAVAVSAAEGNPYVISTRTAQASAVPAPESTERPFGVG